MDADGEDLALERLGVARAQAALTGRPASDPRALLTLSLDGDLHRLRASRRLARATHRHVERLWRPRNLRPDGKTMADFGTHHPTALHALCREFGLRGKQLDRFGAALLAMDGRQLKAVNSTPRDFTNAKLEKALKDLDGKIAQDVRDRDPADGAASSAHPPPGAALQEQLKRRQGRPKRSRDWVQAVAASGEPPLSLTDTASRARPRSPTVGVGDTVQLAGDSQPQLMVEPEVTHALTDDAQLRPPATRAKETLGAERMGAVADRGCSPGPEINACDEAGLEAHVPKPSPPANATLGLFGKECFT
jgi:transposase